MRPTGATKSVEHGLRRLLPTIMSSPAFHAWKTQAASFRITEAHDSALIAPEMITVPCRLFILGINELLAKTSRKVVLDSKCSSYYITRR